MSSSFTPQEIEEFLQEFFDVVGARQYIGARYVPIFGRAGEDTVEWNDLAPYEPLTVVMHDGVSYVSRRYVPAGIEITDTAYWVETYRFNAQVEQYRQQVLDMQEDVDNRVPFPDPLHYPMYGTLGQVLSTLADGTTKWEDPVVPSDEQAEEVITAWLDAHPEATTTVQDGSITDGKLSASSTILRYRGDQPYGASHIYDVTGFGIYSLSRSFIENATDRPTGLSAICFLLNLPYNNDPTKPMQMLLAYNTNIAYIRWITSALPEGTEWQQYNIPPDGSVTSAKLANDAVTAAKIENDAITDTKINPASTLMRYRGAPASSATNIYDVTEMGVYSLNAAFMSGAQDKPSDFTANIGYLVNVPYTNAQGYPMQYLQAYNQADIWVRWVSSAYPHGSAWKRLNIPPSGSVTTSTIVDGSITDSKIAGASTINRYKGAPASSATNIYDVTEMGVYSLNAAFMSGAQDKPSDFTANIGYLVNVPYTNAQGYPMQYLQAYNEPELYVRWISVALPHGSRWHRLNIPPDDSVTTDKIADGAVTPDKLSITPNVLTGKKLVTAGDSYTAALFGSENPLTGRNFGYYIAQRCGMEFVNAGISGSIMAFDKTYVDDPLNVDIDTRQPFSYQRYTQIPDDTDYLTIWFGINDASHTYLGTIDDTTSDTFYGAWNKVLGYYLTNRPFMHVGIVVTVGSTAEYRQAVRDVAAKWGYPVLDLVDGTDSPAFFDRDGMSTTARDLRRAAFGYNTWNAHPNPEWHEFISSAFEEFIKRC